MERYLAVDSVGLPTTVAKFAPVGHCDWCGKELTGRAKRFCPGEFYDEYNHYYSSCAVKFGIWWYSIAAFKRAVFIRDRFTCRKCGYHEMQEERPWLPKTGFLHCDHIVPLSRGGETTIHNLQTLCRDCNLAKGDKFEGRIEGKIEAKNRKPRCKCGAALKQIGYITEDGYDPLLIEFHCPRCGLHIWIHEFVFLKKPLFARR